MKLQFCQNHNNMKKTITLLFIILSLGVSAQNNLQLSFTIAHGNSSWQYSNMQIAETGPTGDTLNLYDIDTHANCPTVIGNVNIGYRFNKLTTGIGFSAQHFFINEFITDAIYSEESNFITPTTFSPYDDPQPTHFKFYPFIEYTFLKENNFELFATMSGGTFLTHSVTENSSEGFHWFVNMSAGLDYILNEKLTFSIAPSFDYSRLNFKLFDEPEREEPYFNISSFYSSFSVKYNFSN